MKKIDTEFERLELLLEAKYPTPQVILDATVRLDSMLSTVNDMEWDNPEVEALDKQIEELRDEIQNLAVSENHMLTTIRLHIFWHDMTPKELHMLTGVADFADQFNMHKSKLFDECFVDTLIANGIDTAQKLHDRLDSYFATVSLHSITNYMPFDESLRKFVGFELKDRLIHKFYQSFYDEDEDINVPIERNIVLLEPGVITEQDLISLTREHHDVGALILSKLQLQLDEVIVAEDYDQARVMQTQLDKLK